MGSRRISPIPARWNSRCSRWTALRAGQSRCALRRWAPAAAARSDPYVAPAHAPRDCCWLSLRPAAARAADRGRAGREGSDPSRRARHGVQRARAGAGVDGRAVEGADRPAAIFRPLRSARWQPFPPACATSLFSTITKVRRLFDLRPSAPVHRRPRRYVRRCFPQTIRAHPVRRAADGGGGAEALGYRVDDLFAPGQARRRNDGPRARLRRCLAADAWAVVHVRAEAADLPVPVRTGRGNSSRLVHPHLAALHASTFPHEGGDGAAGPSLPRRSRGGVCAGRLRPSASCARLAQQIGGMKHRQGRNRAPVFAGISAPDASGARDPFLGSQEGLCRRSPEADEPARVHKGDLPRIMNGRQIVFSCSVGVRFPRRGRHGTTLAI